MTTYPIKETPNGLLLCVKVVPKSSRNQIAGWEGDELKVRLNAVPEKGQANDELIAYLAKQLKLAKSQLQLFSGETSRHKKLLITGISLAEFHARLAS